MKKLIEEVWNKWLGSLDTDNTKPSFSARKLSAFAVMCMVGYAHLHFVSAVNLEIVLTIDFGFIAVCLGMTTYETIVKTKQNGSN